MDNSTIVAISSAIGVSAIGIIRISGKDALKIALKITKAEEILPRYAYLKYLYDENDKVVDRGIVIFFKAPHSFNGEDIIELQCHGGIALQKRLLEICIHFGARLARAGEFSKIALLNGKMNFSQLEHISHLISTQNATALTLIAKNLKGDLEGFIARFRSELLEILATSEALIDYAEEEIPNDLSQKIISLESSLSQIYTHSQSMQHIINGHKLAIIGSPNVGKSSILNRLLLKNRAIVSDIAGTTRDSIEAQITIGKQILTIIDTAGIRNSSEAIESLGIAKSREIASEASIILAVFDGSEELCDDEILQILQENSNKIIIVAINKSDKPQKLDLTQLAGYECVSISTQNDSVFKIRDIIEQKIEIAPQNDESVILSTIRQQECLKTTIANLQNARENISDFEIFSFHINEALKSMESISKPFLYDEMLDKMFSSFCLGK